MILKSKPGKSKYYKSLIQYMIKEEKIAHAIVHGMNLKPTETKKIIREFYNNAKPLKKRKNGNYLHHEIISLPKNLKISREKQAEILYDLMSKYIEKRGKHHLAFGVVHMDKDHPHAHIMVSSNEIGAIRNTSSKPQFNRGRRQIEHYQITRFPEVGIEYYYDKRRNKSKAITRNTQLNRIGEITKQALEKSFSNDELQAQLLKYNLKYYTSRGESGISDLELKRKLELKYEWQNKIEKDNIKSISKSLYSYRINKMKGLETAFRNLMEFENERKIRVKELRRVRGKGKVRSRGR